MVFLYKGGRTIGWVAHEATQGIHVIMLLAKGTG
jgi:hypothetical protein